MLLIAHGGQELAEGHWICGLADSRVHSGVVDGTVWSGTMGSIDVA